MLWIHQLMIREAFVTANDVTGDKFCSDYLPLKIDENFLICIVNYALLF